VREGGGRGGQEESEDNKDKTSNAMQGIGQEGGRSGKGERRKTTDPPCFILSPPSSCTLPEPGKGGQRGN